MGTPTSQAGLGRIQQRNRSIAALTRRQHGLLTREQAVSLEISASAIARRLASGAWQRVQPTVFAAREAPSTQAQGLIAVLLWAGAGAVLSHRTALLFWGHPGGSDVIEVSTPQRRGPREGIRVHQTRRVPDEHVIVKDGLTWTSPERTLVDMAGLLGASTREAFEELMALVHDFFRRGVSSPSQLQSLLRSSSARRTPGRRLLRRVMALRRRGAPPTLAELERYFEVVCARNRLRPPELIDPAARLSPHLRCGYADAQVVFELSAKSLALGAGELARLEDSRKQLRGAGWFIQPVSWESLRNERRKTVEVISPLWQPPAQPRVAKGKDGIPAYDEEQVCLRIRRMADHHLLPEVLMRSGSCASALCWVDFHKFDDLDEETMAALRAIIDSVNAGQPLFPDEAEHAS